MPKIFETPIKRVGVRTIELLDDHDNLILEAAYTTKAELDEIIRRVNAYDDLVELLRDYALCDGRISNVADAGILAGRVSAAAIAKLKELGEEP